MSLRSCPPAVEAVRTWNARARELVAQYGMDPVQASRLYFLQSISQLLGICRVPCSEEEAVNVLSISSLVVQNEYFPSDSNVFFETNKRRQLFVFNDSLVALIRQFLKGRRNDGSAIQSPVTLPSDPTHWRSLENRPPVRPKWGGVKPFAIRFDPTEMCPRPPMIGSPDHRIQVERVREATERISPEQLRAVKYWSCDIGGETPAGRWQMLFERNVLPECKDLPEVLYLLALIAAAVFNAGIGCWAVKFKYWFPRPTNVNPRIRTFMHVPNFPSYTSGHSSFSWAVVGALTKAFPKLKAWASELANEAAQSRVWGGVHYPCDSEGGKVMGLQIGAITREEIRNNEDICKEAISTVSD